MIRRILGLLAAFVAAAFLATVSVANRHPVTLVLDPFDPQHPALSIVLPFYAYLYAVLIAGVLLGGAATWFGQWKWRRLARKRTREALGWRAEADRLARERDEKVSERKKQLALAGR